MTDLDFFLQLVCARSKIENKAVAIAVDEKYNVVGMGIAGANPCETAIANLLQAAQGRLNRYWLFASYVPQPLCLGMANILGIDSVGFADGSTFKDAARTQQIVSLRQFPSDAVAIFSGSAKPLPDWQTAPQKYLDDLKGPLFASLAPSYQTAVKSMNACTPFANRDLPAKIQQIFGQAPATAAAGPLDRPKRDYIYMHLAFGLVGETWNPVLHWDVKDNSGERLGGNNVGAVIVHNGQIIAWGLNMASQNPVFHAETLAILSYLKKGNAALPDGATIYTSLEPCKMCSGSIVAAGANIEVVVGAHDHLISTVISGSKRYNGCYQRSPDVPAVKQGEIKLFGGVERMIDNRRGDSVAASSYDLSSDGGGGASTRFLRDESDEKYRDSLRDKASLSGQSATRLNVLKGEYDAWNRNGAQFKKLNPFAKQKELNTLLGKESAVAAKTKSLTTNFASGNFGKKFSSYLDVLAARWKVLKPQPDSAERRAYEQAICVLRITAVEGLSTNYGVNFVNALFSDFA